MNGRELMHSEWNGRRGRPRMRWEDCVMRGLAGLGGGQWRIRVRGSGDGSETVTVMEGEPKSRTSINVTSPMTSGTKRSATTPIRMYTLS